MSQNEAFKLVQNRHYLVGSIDPAGYFSVASRPFGHTTKEAALEECSRLANLKPGTAYIAMQTQGGSILPIEVKPYYL